MAMKGKVGNSLYLLLFALMLTAGCKSAKKAQAGDARGFLQKKMLKSIEVTSIRVDQYPKYGKDGNAWDSWAPLASDPDLYVTFLWKSTVIYQSETKDDCSFSTPVNFVQGLPFFLKPMDQTLMLEIFDEDGISNDDNVGYIQLVPKELPVSESVTLTSSNGELKVTLGLKLTYE